MNRPNQVQLKNMSPEEIERACGSSVTDVERELLDRIYNASEKTAVTDATIDRIVEDIYDVLMGRLA